MRKMVEYVVLASLAHESRSGYDVTKWLTSVASHFWPVVHSGIYPALAALESDGLVRHETVTSEHGPARKVYSLTMRGQQDLLAWVDSPAPTAQVRDEQLVRALCYGYLPPELALARLAQVRQAHIARLAHYEALQREIMGVDAAGKDEVGVADSAQLGKLLVVRRGILSEQGYLHWCEEAALLIEALRRSSGV